MPVSSIKLIFFFLSIVPNLVICLNKDQDCTCKMDIAKKIVGGSESQLPGTAIVSLYSQNNYDGLTESEKMERMIKDYLCSAFVLNEKWVMTSQKCILFIQGNLTVGVGYDKIKMIEQGKIKVKNIIHHDNQFISLLELDSPIDLNKFKPVCLDVKEKHNYSFGKNFIGAGFGKVSPQKENTTSGEIENLNPGRHTTESRYLKQIELIDDFSTSYSGHEMHLKSAKKKLDALCFGDEGGPLYYLSNKKLFVVGLLIDIGYYEWKYINDDKFAYYCGGDGKAFYLKITPYIDWIKGHLGENNYCDEPPKKSKLDKLMKILK